MAAKSLTLLLVLVLFLTPSLQNPPTRPPTSPPNPNVTPHLRTFINNMVGDFSSQCLPQRTQFGVLILVPPNSNLSAIEYRPSDRYGHPLTNRNYGLSPSRREYGNYLVARPNRGEHSEAQLLRELHNLWNAYLNQHNNQLPEMIVLYSWIIPCRDCTDRIRTHLAQRPYNQLPIYVIYTTLSETEQNPRGNMALLHQQGIDTFRMCYNIQRSLALTQEVDTCNGDECGISGAFQFCLLDCAADTRLSGCADVGYEKKAAANFINMIVAACYENLVNIEECALRWMERFVMPSCWKLHGAGFEKAKNSLRECFSKCNDKHFSNPIDALNLRKYTGLLAKPYDLQHISTPIVECTDNRLMSTLCSEWREDYLTAGNSLCKQACSRSGQSYSWCEVEGPSYYKWEYCCIDDCKKHNGADYYWCKTGDGSNDWENCTPKNHLYSRTTYNGKNCHTNSLCGQHGYTDEYFCYTDSENWDYCCRPDHPCGKYGESYYWCYISDDGDYKKGCIP